MSDSNAEREMKRMSRRGFLWGALAVAFGFEAIRYLNTRATEAELPWPFRRVLTLNEDLAGDYLSNKSLAKEYPREEASMPIDSGNEGLSRGLRSGHLEAVAGWRERRGFDGELGRDSGSAARGYGDRTSVYRGVVQDCPLDGVPAARFCNQVQAERGRDDRPRPRRQAAALRRHRDAGCRLLRGSGYGERAASADAALLGDERETTGAGARRAAPAGHSGEVRDQEHQADRNPELHHHASAGIIGPSRVTTSLPDFVTERRTWPPTYNTAC